MTTRPYKEWIPDALAEGAEASVDPLSEQVATAEDRDVLRDPMADAKPTITRVFNGREPGIVSGDQVDHGQHSAPTIERIEQRGHIDPLPPSTDPHSDDMLDRVEGIAHHRGVLRRYDAQGREAFSIRFRESGRIVTQAIDARSLEVADEALAAALAVPGREALR
jgi:hypothetical protein